MRFVQFILLIGLFAFSFAKKNYEDPCACKKIQNDKIKQFCEDLITLNALESIKQSINVDSSGDTAKNECYEKTRPDDKINCNNLVKFLKNCNKPKQKEN